MELLLLFRLGDVPYALEVGQVQEIVEAPELFYIPRAPAFFSGAVNIRGAVLPVLDLAAYLGYPGEERDRRIIVLPPHLCAMALAVSTVGRIVPLDRDALLPPLERRSRDSYVRSMLERGGETINLLDLARLIASLETFQ